MSGFYFYAINTTQQNSPAKSLGRKTFTKFMFRVFCKIENIIIIIVKPINITHQFL